MKKYFDAMYDIFSLYHRYYERRIAFNNEELWRELNGVTAVSIHDKQISVAEHEILINLQNNLYDVAEIYFKF